MLSIEERKKIQDALPISKSNGYKLINEKLPGLTRGQICQAFLYDNRYKPEVMVAAMEVVEEYKHGESLLKKKIAAL